MGTSQRWIWLFLLARSRGNEYDSHGCDLSAGQNYCAENQKCVSSMSSECPTHGTVRDCGYAWAGLSWDLSGLKRPQHYTFGRDTSYAVSICENLRGADVDSTCAATRGSASEEMMDDQGAFQLLHNTKECFRCGVFDNDTVWGLVNDKKPAEGIFVRYEGGNTCPGGSPTLDEPCTEKIGYGTYCRRSMTLKFLCNDVDDDDISQLREESGCTYVAVLNSRYGCPLECPRSSKTGFVCSGHGVCAYSGIENGFDVDGNVGLAGCDCDHSYHGIACEEYGYYAKIATPSEDHRTDVLFALGIVFLVVGVGSCLLSYRSKLLSLLSGNLVNTSENDAFINSSNVSRNAPPYQLSTAVPSEDSKDDDHNPFLGHHELLPRTGSSTVTTKNPHYIPVDDDCT